MNQNHCIDVCNGLLRGERSAVETYEQAIIKMATESVAPELKRIYTEHSNAVSILEQNVQSMGGQPDRTAGAWGSIANAIQGTANLLGNQAALESLEAGEKSGKSDYERALDDDKVMDECKELIRSRLLPSVEEHIQALTRLQKA